MGINVTSTVAIIIANNNATKSETIKAALYSGDMKALAAAIRPAGEFARVSCPSSLEFGDTDINFHGKKLANLADGHESDRDNIMVKVGRIADRVRNLYGQELRDAKAERNRLQGQATRHGDIVRRIDAIIDVLKEELALRESDRAAYAAKVAAEKAAREAVKTIAVMEPSHVPSLPAKWLKKPAKVKTIARKRNEIAVDSFEALAEIIAA